MAKKAALLLLISLLIFLFACSDDSYSPPETFFEATIEFPTEAATTAVTTEATEPAPLHSPLYIEGLEVEDVIRYFNEVCLDAEFVNSGNASLVQKWSVPIRYSIEGTPTDEDMAVLNDFADWLNSIEGFSGISLAADPAQANLRIHFCTQQELLQLMGDNYGGMDGAVTFWYNNNHIYDAIICYRTDLEQTVRNSVILEEIYNGLGPIQDTQLRSDSIIYSGYSEPQQLTAIDELILRLLYHPQIRCGMDAQACEAAIRALYY